MIYTMEDDEVPEAKKLDELTEEELTDILEIQGDCSLDTHTLLITDRHFNNQTKEGTVSLVPVTNKIVEEMLTHSRKLKDMFNANDKEEELDTLEEKWDKFFDEHIEYKPILIVKTDEPLNKKLKGSGIHTIHPTRGLIHHPL